MGKLSSGGGKTKNTTEPWPASVPFLTGTQEYDFSGDGTGNRFIPEAQNSVFGSAPPSTGGGGGNQAPTQQSTSGGASGGAGGGARNASINFSPGTPGVTNGQITDYNAFIHRNDPGVHGGTVTTAQVTAQNNSSNSSSDASNPTVNGVKNGGSGIPGVLPESARLYKQNRWNSDQEAVRQARAKNLMERNKYYQPIRDGANDIIAGAWDPRVQRVKNINGVDDIKAHLMKANTIRGVSDIGYDRVSADNVNASQARRAQQGVLDPTRALYKLLNNTSSNPHLDAAANAITRKVNQNTLENLLPQVRSGAVGAGQFGSSRQGIAEGLALSRAQEDISSALAAMYQQSYENAQDRSMNIANALNNQAAQLATTNADRNLNADLANQSTRLDADRFNANKQLDTQKFNATSLNDASRFNATSLNNADQFNANKNLDTQKFNADIGFRNNDQEMQRVNTAIDNRMKGLDAMNKVNRMEDLDYSNFVKNLNSLSDWEWDQLNKYANIAFSGAGLGGTQTQKQKGAGFGVQDALGAALGLAGLFF